MSDGSTLNEIPKPIKMHIKQIVERLDHKLVDNFHPAFFTSIMGTGIAANILSNFPYPAHWLVVCSYIMFGLAASLFIGTTVLMVMSCYRDPHQIVVLNIELSTSVFMGCYAMGFTTLVNYIYFLTKDKSYGPIVAFCLWWIAVILSLYTALITFYYSYVAKLPNHDFDLKDMHITLLMPIVTLTVVASSGNVFALALPTLKLKVLTLVVTFILWSNAIVIAFIITTLYFYKLFVHKIPDTKMVFSSFLPVGFLGQGSYAILLFGNNCYQLIREVGVTSHYFKYLSPQELEAQQVTSLIIGNCVIITSVLVGLLLVAFGYFMTFLLVISALSKIAPFTSQPNPEITKHGLIKFHRGFWSMTFPLGTMALGNTEIWRILGDGFVFFRVMGSIYATWVMLITIGCLAGVGYKLWRICIDEESKV